MIQSNTSYTNKHQTYLIWYFHPQQIDAYFKSAQVDNESNANLQLFDSLLSWALFHKHLYPGDGNAKLSKIKHININVTTVRHTYIHNNCQDIIYNYHSSDSY